MDGQRRSDHPAGERPARAGPPRAARRHAGRPLRGQGARGGAAARRGPAPARPRSRPVGLARDVARLRALVRHEAHRHRARASLARPLAVAARSGARRADGPRPPARADVPQRALGEALGGWPRTLYRRTAAVFAVSRQIEARCREVGLPADRVLWIPGAADLPRFGAVGTTAARSARSSSSAAPRSWSRSSRLAANRGHELLLAGFRRLLQRMPEARLLLVGKGERRDRLEQLVAELGLGASRDLHGLSRPRPAAGARRRGLLRAHGRRAPTSRAGRRWRRWRRAGRWSRAGGRAAGDRGRRRDGPAGRRRAARRRRGRAGDDARRPGPRARDGRGRAAPGRGRSSVPSARSPIVERVYRDLLLPRAAVPARRTAVKLLQLVSCRGWSSDAYWAARVTRELERRGHEVTLGCRRGTERARGRPRARARASSRVVTFGFAGGLRPGADAADVRQLRAAVAASRRRPRAPRQGALARGGRRPPGRRPADRAHPAHRPGGAARTPAIAGSTAAPPRSS